MIKFIALPEFKSRILTLVCSLFLFLVTFCSCTLEATAAITNNKPVAKPSTTGKGVIAEPSNDFHIPFNKGDALVKLGKYNESIQYFDKALAINPKFVPALNDKGAALFVLGKYNESIQYFDKALAINPNNPLSLLNKGSALNKLGKYNESISYYNKVLAKEPTNPQASAGKKLDTTDIDFCSMGVITPICNQ